MKIYEARAKTEHRDLYSTFPFYTVPTLYIESDNMPDMGLFVYPQGSTIMTYFVQYGHVEKLKEGKVQHPEEHQEGSMGGVSLKTLIGEGVRKVEISYE